MTWVLIIAYAWAITGYPTKEACLAAGQDVKGTVWCIPVGKDGQVIGNNSTGR